MTGWSMILGLLAIWPGGGGLGEQSQGPRVTMLTSTVYINLAKLTYRGASSTPGRQILWACSDVH